MRHGQGKNSRNKFPQELSRMNDYRKSGRHLGWLQLLVQRFDGFHGMPSERREGCEILFALEGKNRHGEFQAKLRGPDGLRLRHQAIPTDTTSRLVRSLRPSRVRILALSLLPFPLSNVVTCNLQRSSEPNRSGKRPVPELPRQALVI